MVALPRLPSAKTRDGLNIILAANVEYFSNNHKTLWPNFSGLDQSQSARSVDIRSSRYNLLFLEGS